MKRKMCDQLLALSRLQKRILQMEVDAAVILAAFILAMALWLDGVGVLNWFPIQLVAAISITELAKQMVSQSGFTRVIVALG